MVTGSCIGGIMYDPGNLHRVRIMACPAVGDMYMHPLLLKTCFLLDVCLYFTYCIQRICKV